MIWLLLFFKQEYFTVELHKKYNGYGLSLTVIFMDVHFCLQVSVKYRCHSEIS